MLYNSKAKVSSIVSTSERIQPDPVLNGNKVTRVSEMRYLGLEFNDWNGNSSHLKKRKSMAYACLSRLFSSRIYCKSETDPKLVVQLYRTYIRPVLLYGNENFEFNTTEKSKLCAIDGNIVKSMLGMPIQCHTTDLVIAFGMDTCEQYLNNCKAKFIHRLTCNETTKSILQYTIKEKIKNSLTMSYFDKHEICEDDRTYDKLVEISLYEIKKFNLLKHERKNNSIEINEKITTIRKLINNYETILFQNELFKIIKFDDDM